MSMNKCDEVNFSTCIYLETGKLLSMHTWIVSPAIDREVIKISHRKFTRMSRVFSNFAIINKNLKAALCLFITSYTKV